MPTALTPGDGQDLLQRFKRAWERLDVDAAVELFREDAEYRLDPFEPALMGAIAIRAYWNEVAATQVHREFDAERVWVTGPTVLASWHGAATQRATAERVRYRGFMTLELDEAGLVSRGRMWSLARSVGRDATHRPETPAGEALGGSDGR
ncbi:MAG: nuclear transport factor 2 family protein [Candidatus Limnocylindrales bacterium]